MFTSRKHAPKPVSASVAAPFVAAPAEGFPLHAACAQNAEPWAAAAVARRCRLRASAAFT
eukprot:4030107-Alexandrium_andersonii.AAC.1